MVSVFEHLVTKQAVRCMIHFGDLQDQEKPDDLCGAIKKCCAKELQHRNFMEVLDAFKIKVHADLVGQVKQICDYRSWVVHGRRGAKPFSITPAEAYKRLSRFLEEAAVPD